MSCGSCGINLNDMTNSFTWIILSYLWKIYANYHFLTMIRWSNRLFALGYSLIFFYQTISFFIGLFSFVLIKVALILLLLLIRFPIVAISLRAISYRYYGLSFPISCFYVWLYFFSIASLFYPLHLFLSMLFLCPLLQLLWYSN